jgi:hypothetical protein
VTLDCRNTPSLPDFDDDDDNDDMMMMIDLKFTLP